MFHVSLCVFLLEFELFLTVLFLVLLYLVLGLGHFEGRESELSRRQNRFFFSCPTWLLQIPPSAQAEEVEGACPLRLWCCCGDGGDNDGGAESFFRCWSCVVDHSDAAGVFAAVEHVVGDGGGDDGASLSLLPFRMNAGVYPLMVTAPSCSFSSFLWLIYQGCPLHDFLL